MKKLFALILAALCLLACLSACGDSDTPTSSDSTDVSTSSESESSESSADSGESSEELPGVKDLADLSPYLTLGTVKGVSVAEKAIVNEQVMESVLKEEFLESLAEFKEAPSGTVAEEGHKVVVDFKGYLIKTGEAFEGGEAKDSEVEIGAGNFVEGFEDGIVGHMVGDSFDVYLTFPEDYKEGLAGEEVRFAMTLKKISVKVYPDVDDELAKSLEFESLEAMNQKVAALAEEKVLAENMSAAWKVVLEGVEIKEYPKELYDSYVDWYVDYYTGYYGYYASMYGMEYAAFLEYAFGMTEKEFVADLTEAAEKYAEGALKEELTVYAVADAAFGREIDDAEYKATLEEYAKEQGKTASELETENGRETLEENMLWDKVMKYIYDNAVFGPVTQ